MLLATSDILLVNLLAMSGYATEEMVKVGWYSEFGGNSMFAVRPVYVWLNLPYTICFYLFSTLFFAKVKSHVNKWLGGTAFVLWCINLVPFLMQTVSNLYIVLNFSGSEMYQSLENYWKTSGKYDYPFMWFMIYGDWERDIYICGHWVFLATFLAFTVIFAFFIKRDKVFGSVGVVAMGLIFLAELLQPPYGFLIDNVCWIALCATILSRLRQSSSDKPFMLS